MKNDYAKMLQIIYDHELHSGISWFWDGGFDWFLRVGNEEFTGNTLTYNEAVERVWAAALKHVPERTRLSLLGSYWPGQFERAMKE